MRINVIFALILFGSTLIGEKTLLERMMGNTLHISKLVWYRLTLSWTGFFVFIAVLNIVIAYKFSETTWVNFKLFGILGLTFCFLVLQALYVSKQSEVDQS